LSQLTIYRSIERYRDRDRSRER